MCTIGLRVIITNNLTVFFILTLDTTSDDENEKQIDYVAIARKRRKTGMTQPQWINCDIRYLDLSVLGKFTVIMADPPWDIHMELPYGTMTDDEMKNMRIRELSDDGLFFLWVSTNIF